MFFLLQISESVNASRERVHVDLVSQTVSQSLMPFPRRRNKSHARSRRPPVVLMAESAAHTWLRLRRWKLLGDVQKIPFESIFGCRVKLKLVRRLRYNRSLMGEKQTKERHLPTRDLLRRLECGEAEPSNCAGKVASPTYLPEV